MLMCSVTGYDASSRVDDLAAELNKPITSIAIGMSNCSLAVVETTFNFHLDRRVLR